MYAYIDGNRPVGMGVYFCYVLFDDCRQIGIPIVEGILEYLNNILGIHLGAICRPAVNNVLQLTFSGPEPIHLIPKLRDIHSVQNCLQAVVDLCGHRGQLCPLCLQVGRGVVHLVGDVLSFRFKICLQQVSLQLLNDKGLNFICVDILCGASTGTILTAADIAPCFIALFVGGGMANIGCSTLLTLDQAGQQIGPLSFILGVAFVVTHSFLHLLPKFWADDGGDQALQPDTVRIRCPPGPLSE